MASTIGKETINSFAGGMDMDLDLSLLKSSQYRYAENVHISSDDIGSVGALSPVEDIYNLKFDVKTYNPTTKLYSTIVDSSLTGEEVIASATIRDFGVLFTNVISSGNTKIYRIEFKPDGITPILYSLIGINGISMNIDLNTPISIVSRYEDDDNIKVYWADGKIFIRSINIASSNDGKNSIVTNSSIFDIIPSAFLEKPTIASLGSGKLNSGIIQYFYQLYGPSGTETMLSPGSAPINLSASDIEDKSIKYLGTGLGDVYGKPTSKSVRVKIDLPSENLFTRIKLISVYYFDYGKQPIISIVKESKIDKDIIGNSVFMEDGGVSAIGELTQNEFNLIGGNLFIPNYIESKDNILFAANTKEDTWDIDTYDTRSYQFKRNETGSIINVVRYTPITNLYPIQVNWEDYFMYVYVDAAANQDMLITVRHAAITHSITTSTLFIPAGDVRSDFLRMEYRNEYLSGMPIVDITCSISHDGVYDEVYGTWSNVTGIYQKTTDGVLNPTTLSLPMLFEETVYDYNYTTKLYRSNLDSIEYDADSLSAVLPSHDAIHDEIYKKDRYSELEYIYNKDGKLGGTGLNVDYLFTNTYFIESYGDFWGSNPGTSIPTPGANKYIDERTARIGDIKRDLSSIRLFKSDGSHPDSNLSNFGISNHQGPLNYANPYLANVLKSYQRDEIYRFAAVFYDEKGRKSPAHWIADVRFPAGYYKDSSWESSIFEMPSEYRSNGYDSNNLLNKQELLVKPLGISFTFRNLNVIPNVKRIEIVRAKRDINNKTIYAQGVTKKIGIYNEKHIDSNSGKPILDLGIDGTLRPMQLISMGRFGVAPVMSSEEWIPNAAVSSSNMITGFENYGSTGNLYYEQQLFNDTANSDPKIISYNNFMFINPETSYYGVDFSEQLINLSSIKIADIVDIIYPIQTPPLLSDWSVYFGKNEHDQLSFIQDSKQYPTAIYLAADITRKNRASNLSERVTSKLFLMGLAGIEHLQVLSDEDIDSSYNNPIVSLGSNVTRIYPDGADEYYYYRNGFESSSINGEDDDDPSVKNSTILENNYLGISFKYFNKYAYKVGTFYNLTYKDIDGADINEIGEDLLDDNKYTFTINSIEYSGLLDGSKNIKDVSASEYISIGNSQYLNFTQPVTDGVQSTNKNGKRSTISKGKSFGPHGAGLILNFNMEESLPSITGMRNWRSIYDVDTDYASSYRNIENRTAMALSTFVVNLKELNAYIYGGSSLLDRQFTEYISTGFELDLNNSTETIDVFGGDTFIGLFDYTMTYATDPMVDTLGSTDLAKINLNIVSQVKNINSLIPLESSINLHLVNSKSYVASDYNFAIRPEPGVYSPGNSVGNTWKYSQELPQYSYNSAYSSEQTGIGYVSSLLINEPNKNFDCRIYSSEVKTNDEIYDKWATFKIANYIDVDTQYGQITGLKKFNDKLFFWQENAFGTVSVNERSLITDNNISSLTLGTSGILTRYDYISTSNGFKYGVIGGIIDSDTGLYWFDHNKAQIATYAPTSTGSLTTRMVLSSAKGIQSILNKSKTSLNAQNRIPAVYDDKYGEILMTLNGLINTNE